MTPEHAAAEAVKRLRGTPLAVGGSVMVTLRGVRLPAPPRDVDIVVSAEARATVIDAFPGIEIVEGGRGPWRSDWIGRAPIGDVTVEVIGGFAMEIGGKTVRFPVRVADVVTIAGVDIPLAPLEHWYFIYKEYDPSKAALIREQITETAMAEMARELGLPARPLH